MRELKLLAGGLILFVLSATATAQNVAHGEDEYKLCASCHGFRGEGNALVAAPALAGMESWYVARQLQAFRDGLRGSASDDSHGQTMATMTRGLEADHQIENLIAYIDTLPAAKPTSTLSGDVSNGQELYTPCAACHGVNAEGNVSLNSPALTTTGDWYQVAQLKKFKSGERGAEPGDTYGMQMAPMAATLNNEQAMHDVVAYIKSLR